MLACARCEEKLSDEGDFINCSGCSLSYHYPCAGVAQATWRAKSYDKKKEWRCASCKKTTSTTVKSRIKSASEENLPTISQRKNIEKVKMPKDNQPDDIMGMIRAQFQVMTDQLNERHAESDNLAKKNGEKMDSILLAISNLKTDMKKVKESQERLERENVEAREEIATLKQQVESANFRERQKNIQLVGIPETNDEDLKDIVNKIARKIKVETLPTDVDEVFRVSTNNLERGRPVIVVFNRKSVRDSFVSQIKKQRLQTTDINPAYQCNPVYANDHLTPYYHKLLFEAKKKQQEKGYKYLWFRNGKLLIKKDTNEDTKVINCEMDLENL